MELNLAVVASRSSLIGALLRTVDPSTRLLVRDFLGGLSRDELECLAEFEGASALESLESSGLTAYHLLPVFFDPSATERWKNSDDCAHKTFVVLAWLECRFNKRSSRLHSVHC